VNLRRLISALVVIFLAVPSVATAFPFGGQIGQIIFCYNNAIYASVGPPRGGPYIWTPSTKTYQFGPPMRVGQWLLGLAAPPYYCLVSVQPIIVWSGILMTMEGSSGAPAAGAPGGGLGNAGVNPPITAGPGGSGGGSGTGRIGHLVISEVYSRVDLQHGGTTAHQWIELYNDTNTAIDAWHWTIVGKNTSQTIAEGTTIPARGYLVLAGTTSVRTIWTIPNTAEFRVFPSAFAGFSTSSDHVYLQDPSGKRVDAVSWGADTGAFNPPASTTALGYSLIRKDLVSDTDTAKDWVSTAAPNPGR
jgi:hypothetical protein